MKSQYFLSWMQATGIRTAADIVRALDVSRNLAQRWVSAAESGEDVPIKRTVALSMSAIERGLLPWGSNGDESHE